MPARKPQEANILVCQAINDGDMEAALALYEPDASFVPEPGQVVTGREAIRQALEGFMALKPALTIEVTTGCPVWGHSIAVLRVVPYGH